MKEISLEGKIYDFSIEYSLINVKNILHIHDELMQKPYINEY